MSALHSRPACAVAMSASRVVSLAAVLWVVVAAARADAQQGPVEVSAHGLFGNEVLLQDGYGAVLFEAQNRTSRPLRGRAIVEVSPSFGDGARTHHELPLDLPPRAQRRVVFTVFVGPGGSLVRARFEHDGRRYEAGTLSGAYAPEVRAVVLLAEPPRMRGGLLDLQVEVETPQSGVARAVTVPLGVASLDARTGDPLLPERSVAYANVGALVAEAPLLTRASATQRRALEDWLRAGGRLVVIPRSDADLRDPALRGLLGDVARGAALQSAARSPFVPEAVTVVPLRCGADQRMEAFGCVRPFGFGRVYVVAYDLNAPSIATSPEVRALVQAIVVESLSSRSPAALLAHGAHEERSSDPQFFSGGNRGVHFTALRAALDPNENYRVGLVIASLLLVLYVLAVGPLNFAFVARRGSPALALVTTPALAALGLVLMLAVGAVGKGVRMRYRAVEFAEAVEGQSRAVARRYTGYFLTRPAAFPLTGVPGGALTMVPGAGGDVAPTGLDDGERMRLTQVRGRLWETLVAREDAVVPLGGTVAFERAGTRLVAVHNGLEEPLLGAVVVEPGGAFYRVGDIPAGGRVLVSTNAVDAFPAPGFGWAGDEGHASGRTFASALGLTADDDVALVRGLVAFLGGMPGAAPAPSLFARRASRGRDAAAGRFTVEREHRFVRIVPRVEPTALTVPTNKVLVPDSPIDSEASE
jgi:hypothetical protein